MGEDSCRGSGGGMCAEKKSANSAGMSTCSEEDNESGGSPPSPEENPEEELEYGPGIVSKLRTRFLSITLKQQNRGLLRSNMRRSCSLEDLLDQGRSPQDMFTSKGCYTRGNREKGCQSSWSNLKRAKSMDSLLLGGEDQLDKPNAPEELSQSETNEVLETLTCINHNMPKLVKRKEGVLNRSTVTICDEELPKPDTVKIYKRMFEPADAKRGMSHSNVRRKPPVLRASAKVGTTTATKLPAHQKKIANGNLSPKEMKNIVSKENGGSSAKSKFESKERAQVNGVENIGTVKNGPIENRMEGKKQTDAFKCRPVGKKNFNPPIKEEEEDAIISDNHCLDNKKDDTHPRYRVRATKKSFESSSKPLIPPNKPVQVSTKKLNPASPEKKLSLKKQAPEAPKHGQTLPKETTIQDEMECNSRMKKEDGDLSSRTEPKEDSVLDSKVMNGLASPPPLTNGHICDSQTSSDPERTGIENNLSINQSNKEPALSVLLETQQADKMIQMEPFPPPPPPPFPSNSIPGSVKTPLWQRKTCQGGCGNSMVFDFRGKDVVHHLSVQPVPFGNKALRTRSLLIDGKEAIPYTNGSVNGSARDGHNEDDDEEYEMDYSYPPPSGVMFEGENVIVGKGAILSVRNKSLKIQFDDDVTDTFVYPSESSLLEECESLTTTTSSETESDAIEDDGFNDENDFSNGRSPKLRANTTIGITGGLATYTPSVLRTVDNFEPGMFRPTQNEVTADGEKSKHESPVQNGIEDNEDGEDEMLKPADPELISSWSLSTTTSDLLF